MSKGMLGKLPLSAWRGPRDTLEELLAGHDGHSVLEELKKFNRREPCWIKELSNEKVGFISTDFKKRITIALEGRGLSGENWIRRLVSGNYHVGDWAKSVLCQSAYGPHRLSAGKKYRVVFVLGKEIGNDLDRTTANLKAVAVRDYGLDVVVFTRAELAPLILEAISDSQMEQLGIWYIAVLHKPIFNSDGVPYVLSARRDITGRWLRADRIALDCQWPVNTAFAFLVPESD